MHERVTIRGGRVVLPESVLENATLVIERGVIRDVIPGRTETRSDDGATFDATGSVIGPGFIDPHCHGDGVTRFFDDPDRVAANLLRQGTTGVLATLGYPDMVRDDIGGQLQRFAASLQPQARDVLAGVHLEGPYVNRKYGAQTSRGVIKDFDPVEYGALIARYGKLIKWWTCAPELPGAGEFIAAVAAHGHVVAAGHTEATPEQIERAIRLGLRVITHWTNATGNPAAAAYLGTRRPGIDEAALVFDELSAEIIPDSGGRHVHPLMAKLLYKAKGPDRVLVITDAGYGRADDPTDPKLAELDVSIDRDGNLAGSRLTMAGAARNFRQFSGCTWPELFRMASLNAARLLGISREVGSIEPGKLANLVVCDEGLRVRQTFLRGREVLP
ncbi:MAG: hypothetical protein JWM88_1358 [Verrucomicrobia bacterium]|nr:hypothetical protein [Verrucomicrobiota bacterium]